jgi:hypothetical protein
MKKLLICGAVLAAATATLSTSAFALDRANTAQKGSLLVFPKVDVSPGRDTLIRIENGYYAGVDVKCYWQNGTKQSSDFQFKLTKFQPYVIIASETFPRGYGPLGVEYGPTDRGELKCWAVSYDGQAEISWNHLSGSATIFDFERGSAHEYTAWAFRCLAEANNPRAECGTTPGVLLMDGTEYDYCPLKLTTGFSPTNAFGGLFGPSYLTVATCNQDFRQDKELFFTKLDFKVWREDEKQFTGAYQCIDSWYETTLDGVENNPQNFSQFILGNNARFVVKGVQSTACNPEYPTSNAGLVGVIATEIGGGSLDSTPPGPSGTINGVAGTNLVGFGEIPGFVAYDTADTIPEGPVAP